MRPEITAVRTAERNGRRIVTLECSRDDAGYSIAAEVAPARSPGRQPLTTGSYRFERAEEAQAFLETAARALTYLGCDVAQGARG